MLAEEQAADMAELEAQSDAEVLAALELPDPDMLEPGDDFSGFMAKAVPDRLRRRALRRLWLSNPALANVDGLVDYGEDFTDAACVIENLQTAYQVGKGMTSHIEEMARKAELEAEGDAEETEDTPEEIVMAEQDNPAAPIDPIPYEAPVFEESAQSPDDGPAPRRRMIFSFDDQPSEEATA